jgi:hypothetical protein
MPEIQVNVCEVGKMLQSTLFTTLPFYHFTTLPGKKKGGR